MSYLKNDEIKKRIVQIRNEKKKLLEKYSSFNVKGNIVLSEDDAKYNEDIVKELEERIQFYEEDIIVLTEKLIEANTRMYSGVQNHEGNITQNENDIEVNPQDYELGEIFSFNKQKDNWFTNNNKIQIKDDFFISNMEESFAYVSYLEKNVNFNKTPESNIINISKDFRYYFEFLGEKSSNLQAQLFIISYSDKDKLYVDSVELGNISNICFDENVKKIRLAIKLTGKGEVKLDQINIYRKRKWDFLNYEQLNKLGFLKPKKINDLKIACIFDEFTMGCFKPEANLITFTPDDWKIKFSMQRPDILIVESAWIGNFGAWNRKISVRNPKDREDLKELVSWCKTNNIPTMFWNKEDPVHFNAFIETASLFDYIFTTDQNSVPGYIEKVRHNRVYAMPFAAQPAIHNPTKISENRINKACFAGSYYAKKYEDRQQDIARLFDVFEGYGLDIYDRNFGENNPDFTFPEKYRDSIKGKLVGEEIQKAYKGYKFMININSVKESPTMFSRRVYEGLASNTPVISSYSQGMNMLFPNIVVSTDDENELKKNVDRLINDKEAYDKTCLLGLREVMQKHTYRERLKFMLSKTDIDFIEDIKEVTVISFVNNESELEKILHSYNDQCYPFKKLVILTDSNSSLKASNVYKDITILYCDDTEINEVLEGEYFSIFNVNNYYGKNFLTDLMIAHTYAGSDVAGKASYFRNDNDDLVIVNEEMQYIYCDSVILDAAVFNRKIFRFIAIKDLIQGLNNSKPNQTLSQFGIRFYATDKYNFLKDYDVKLANELSGIVV